MSHDTPEQNLNVVEAPPRFISVIIPVYNDSERLIQCLQALEEQTYPDDSYEVIVVDNASEEDINSVVAQFPHATIVLETQRGSYAARNTGIAIAQGPMLAFTDADCIPSPNWLKNGVQSLLSVPNCGLVAGRIQFSFQQPNAPTSIELCDSVLYLQQDLYLTHAKFGATANVFTFKSVFDQVGLFDHTLKSGGDYEWGQRVFAAGYQQVYAEEAYISHPARSSFQELYTKILRTTRGPYDLKRSQNYSWNKFMRDLARDLFPPFKTFARARINHVQPNVQFFVTLTLIKYLTAWERIRAQLNFG